MSDRKGIPPDGLRITDVSGKARLNILAQLIQQASNTALSLVKNTIVLTPSWLNQSKQRGAPERMVQMMVKSGSDKVFLEGHESASGEDDDFADPVERIQSPVVRAALECEVQGLEYEGYTLGPAAQVQLNNILQSKGMTAPAAKAQNKARAAQRSGHGMGRGFSRSSSYQDDEED